MKIEVYLNQKSVGHAIGQLKAYRDSLAAKNEQFVYELLNIGIKVAEERASENGYVKYKKKKKKGKGGITTIGYLVGEDTQKIIAQWEYYDKDNIKTAAISPILFAEFGSANYARVPFDIGGVGQGTFPGQTHAFDGSWWVKKLDPSTGEYIWTRWSGVTPTQPMYHAEMKMYEQIYNVARKVFRTDGR